jgi:secretion/DNA translocation related TadE-like protein
VAERRVRLRADRAGDLGTATAELALALPAVALAAAVVAGVTQVAVAELGCVDAASVEVRADPPSALVVRVRRRVHLVLRGGPSVLVAGEASAEREVPGDAGGATVLVVAVVALAAALAVAIALVSGAVVARHRAAAAADLAALAAASTLASSPCAAAARVAAANGAHVESCRPDATDQAVEVSVSVRPPGVLGRVGLAVARARAGQGWR